MDWELDDKRYINTEFIYKWHPMEAKREGILIFSIRNRINIIRQVDIYFYILSIK